MAHRSASAAARRRGAEELVGPNNIQPSTKLLSLRRAPATAKAGRGSDYGIAYLDANKQPFDGSKTYKLNIPAEPPVKSFWAVTIYDPPNTLNAANQPGLPHGRQPDRGH